MEIQLYSFPHTSFQRDSYRQPTQFPTFTFAHRINNFRLADPVFLLFLQQQLLGESKPTTPQVYYLVTSMWLFNNLHQQSIYFGRGQRIVRPLLSQEPEQWTIYICNQFRGKFWLLLKNNPHDFTDLTCNLQMWPISLEWSHIHPSVSEKRTCTWVINNAK